MLNWRTRGPDHWASNPLQAPCPAVDSEQGRKIHDGGIFLQAMENFLRGTHDMVNSAYVMEGFPEKCHGMGIYLYIMEKFTAKFHDMWIPSYTMENSFECIHDIGTFSYTMDYSLTGIHEMKTFSYIMEKFLRGIHDMGNSAYVMEKVFLAACFCLSEQYYQQNPRLVLLQQKTASSSINRIHIQYCSESLSPAVVSTESAFSTAPTEEREQYSANNYCSVLLRQLVISSTINRIRIQYCFQTVGQSTW